MINCVGGFGHRSVEEMRQKLRTRIQEYVIRKQAMFKFGTDDGNWTEVEADEVTLAKRASGGKEYFEWCQCLGLMQHGVPETLVLEALPVRQCFEERQEQAAHERHVETYRYEVPR